MKNKTLQEVYENSSDEVRKILKSKFSNKDLGIIDIEQEIRNEILKIIRENIKNVRFLDKYDIVNDVPSPRFEICDENGKWLFNIDYDEKNKHFWFSYYRVFQIFESKYGVNYLKFKEILKGIMEDELNLMGVTPSLHPLLHHTELEEELNLMGVTPGCR